MRSKFLLFIAVLAVAIAAPAAMAAGPVWEANYTGYHGPATSQNPSGWEYTSQSYYQGQPYGQPSVTVAYLNQGKSFAIDLGNYEEPNLTKIITAWWWFYLGDATSVPNPNPEQAAKEDAYNSNVSVVVTPNIPDDDANYNIVSGAVVKYEDAADLINSGAPAAVINFFTDGQGNYKTGNLENVWRVYKAVWKISPQPGKERLIWSVPQGYTGVFDPCNFSRFYINSQCAPGLPALALIGIPPVIGTLIRRVRKR